MYTSGNQVGGILDIARGIVQAVQNANAPAAAAPALPDLSTASQAVKDAAAAAAAQQEALKRYLLIGGGLVAVIALALLLMPKRK